MEQPKRIGNNGLSKLSKYIWYLIIVRLPKTMQQQIEDIDLSMVATGFSNTKTPNDNPKFAENKRYWDTIVLHYWQKRFEQSKKDSILRFRSAVINTDDSTRCLDCDKPFSMDVVHKCWRCNAYTCTRCATIRLKDAFPNMICPTACPNHTHQCTRCEQLFIPIGNEEHCFDCQHQTGMYTVKWANCCKIERTLPYGSSILQKTFTEFLIKAHSVKQKLPAGQVLIGGIAGGAVNWGNIALDTNTIAIGQTSVVIGYNALGNNNNNNNNQ